MSRSYDGGERCREQVRRRIFVLLVHLSSVLDRDKRQIESAKEGDEGRRSEEEMKRGRRRRRRRRVCRRKVLLLFFEEATRRDKISSGLSAIVMMVMVDLRSDGS